MRSFGAVWAHGELDEAFPRRAVESRHQEGSAGSAGTSHAGWRICAAADPRQSFGKRETSVLRSGRAPSKSSRDGFRTPFELQVLLPAHLCELVSIPPDPWRELSIGSNLAPRDRPHHVPAAHEQVTIDVLTEDHTEIVLVLLGSRYLIRRPSPWLYAQVGIAFVPRTQPDPTDGPPYLYARSSNAYASQTARGHRPDCC